MKPSDKTKLLSVLLKLIVILAAAVGIYRTATAGRGSFMGGSRVFMFFTIQSNIAVALICAVGLWLLFRHTPPKTVWYVVQFVGAVSITLTGVVFAFVLAPTLGSHAWNVQNILTHVVVPVAAVADFFVTGVFGTLQKRHIPLVTLPPLAYAIYA
ncbi:MAG: Pr6Pr family membrane protein, partial [Firmicutes bacterium]|nr:Pr6Pr family membrane protein [Bacillota bacterium]